MKKITLLLLFLFFSVSGYSQLNTEGFDNTPGITGPLPATWPLPTGDWAVFEKNTPANVGTAQSWGINAFAQDIYHSPNQCASVSREQIGQGGLSEDYLATPVVSIPSTGTIELHFWTRMFTSGNQGTVYKLMVAPAVADQKDPNSYTDLQQWTEADLIIPTSNFDIWTEKTVPIPTFLQGQDVYFAFVRVYNQPNTALDGDRWFIDDVGVAAQCVAPVTAATVVTGSTTATLSWANPSGITQWQIEVVPSTGTQTFVPNYTYTSTTPAGQNVTYLITTPPLTPNTTYKYYVRGICSTGFTSPWSAASANFTTQVAPPVCGGNLVDSGGPTGNYSNNENISTTVNPVTPGDVVTVTFTAFNTQANTDFLKIYDGPNTTFPLLANLSGTTLPPSYTSTAASGSLTFVFTSNGSTVAAGYAANITCGPPPACRIPTAVTLTAGSVTTTQAQLSWTQPANPDASVSNQWQVLALPCGSPAPGAGATGFVSAATNTNFVLGGVTPLTPATCYDVYVRAVCGATNSGWSLVPVTFTTLVAPPICGGNFVDSGGLTGNYSNNENLTTVICPVTAGDVVSVNFTSFNTQAGSDLLKVYNGNGTTGTLLATLSGTALPPSFISSDPSGCLTFVFTSNGSTVASGWLANVTCGPPPPCTAPVAVTVSTPATYNSVGLNWTQPNASATAWEILALPCGSPAPGAVPPATGILASVSTATPAPPYTLTGLASLTCYNVYVRAVCSGTSVSAWTAPVTITTLVAPPICGGNFLDPGITADYGSNLNSVVTICPTGPNQLVTVTFTTFDTEATYDGLYVFDGNTVNAPQIPSANGAGNVPGGLAGSFWGTTIPGPFTSSSADGCLTFRFITDGSGVRAGWTSNITCIPAPDCRKPAGFAVPVANVTHNSAQLNWTQPTNPDGSVASAWQVIALPCGSAAPGATPPTTGIIRDISSLTPAPPYIFTGLASETCYDIYVRAVCSPTSSSEWSGPRTITTKIAPPLCGGVFVDPGGSNANYPAVVTDNTTIICPTNPNEVVTVTFTTFATEATWDGLYVFDGNTVNAPQIPSANGAGNVNGGLAGSFWGTLTGANLPGPFTSSSADGCLTFRFRTDGGGVAAGWVANVTCSPAPNCPRPTSLTATQITSSSAYFGWIEPTPTVTQWEVIYVLAGSPAPLPTATGGTIVYINQPLFTGLLPGTQYTYYVRSICPTTGTSAWSVGYTFTTLIINDNCSGAIFAPVNQSAICQQVTPGTLTLATPSTPPPTGPCVGNADDDVWFQFVASNPYLNVALQNVVGTTTNLNFGVYTGACGSLTQIFCSAANTLSGVVNNLIIGQTYFIRVYSNGNTPQTVNFSLCISTPSSCITGQAACQNLTYQNTTGVTSQGTVGCLTSTPNPTYYTINVSNSGPISLLLTQSSTQGGAPNLDVDYAAWGPFTDQAAACAAIGNPPTLAPGIGVPVTQTAGCSFSIASTETLTIPNAVAGQVYVILITNFANQPGFISLTQTNFGGTNAGAYQCCPDAYFTYNPVVYCKSPGSPNPVPTINTGSVAGLFSLSPASPAGLVFANTATGEVDLAASAPGNYLVLNTVAANASCAQKQRGYNISIVAPTTATIAYSAPAYCASVTALQTVTQTGTAGGVYSALPNGGLFINVATGAINPSLSAPGIYTITYGIPGTSACTTGNPSTQVEILPLPNIVQPAAVVVCNSYTLPALTVGSYFSQTGGIGPIDASIPLTSSQTVYIFATGTNGCTNEKSFTVRINTVPTPTFNVTQSSCTTPNGSITVLTPTGTTAPAPTNLFISEVTDATTGALTYVEIFNGTGAPVNLSNYKIRTFNNGATTATTGCDNVLSGTLANNATYVVSVGSATNAGGVTPNQSFAGCTGVNTDDCIKLTTLTNTVIDLWGRTDGVNFTPLNQPGYTYRRLNTATPLPSTTWNAGDWTTTDPEDYTNIGSYSLATSNYQYSIDNGVTYQAGTTFNNLTPGSYTLIVKDLITGCLSTPINIIIDAANSLPTVTDFNYTTPVCQNATTNPLPNTSATGFTPGGVFASNPSTGIDINPTTGEINLANTTAGTYNITYTVVFNPVTCQSFGSTTRPIVITNVITPIVGFNYTTPICQDAQPTLTPTLDLGFTPGGIFRSTTGLTIDPVTGVIDLANSAAGSYTVSYFLAGDTCRADTTGIFNIVINPVITPITGFTYATPVCVSTTVNPMPIPVTGFTAGGTFRSNPSTGITVNPSTGELSNLTVGSYIITYEIAADPLTCRPLTSTDFTIVITNAITPVVNGFSYTTPVCKNAQATLAPNLPAGFTPGGTFSSPGLTINGSTGVIDMTSPAGTYVVTYAVNANPAACQLADSGIFTVVINPVVTLATNFSYSSSTFCAASGFASPNLGTGFTIGGAFSSTTGLTINPTTGAIDLSSTPGTYTVTYTVNPNVANCEVSTPGITQVTIVPPVTIDINGGCTGSKYVLTAFPINSSFDPQTATYSWENPQGIAFATTQSVEVSATGLYTVTVTVNGCSTKSLPFNVESVNCVIQKGISVNNDGLNDTFDLSGFDVKKLTIFNRLGMKVYSRSNYINEWGGKSDDGDELPDGVYYYVIDRNSAETKTGWIYINRAQ